MDKTIFGLKEKLANISSDDHSVKGCVIIEFDVVQKLL